MVHARGHRQALLVDPGDEPDRVLDAVADLDVTAIVLSHAHFDHVLAVPRRRGGPGTPPCSRTPRRPGLAARTRHPRPRPGTSTPEQPPATCSPPATRLRPAPRRPLWDGRVDRHVGDGELSPSDPLTRATCCTPPGHTPGGLSLYLPGGAGHPGHVLTGDTLFPGGPGLTGWPLSDFPTILASVRRLLDLPARTVVHPGHGPDTTVGAERPALPTGPPAGGERAGDVDAVFAAMRPDIEWVESEGMPYGGVYHGRDAW